MRRPPPSATPTDPLFPYTTLVRARSNATQHVRIVSGSLITALITGRTLNLQPTPRGDRATDDRYNPREVGCRLSVRSEEHTSELQSLMRISYAVFCLQKNNTYPLTTQIH